MTALVAYLSVGAMTIATASSSMVWYPHWVCTSTLDRKQVWVGWVWIQPRGYSSCKDVSRHRDVGNVELTHIRQPACSMQSSRPEQWHCNFFRETMVQKTGQQGDTKGNYYADFNALNRHVAMMGMPVVTLTDRPYTSSRARIRLSLNPTQMLSHVTSHCISHSLTCENWTSKISSSFRACRVTHDKVNEMMRE
jgi:hypothetical protein